MAVSKPIEIVERHYNDLMNYNEALSNFLEKETLNTKEDFLKHFEPLIKQDKTDKLEEEIVNKIYKKQLAISERGFYAYKFKRSCEFYMAISDEDLPENIQLEYERVKLADDSKPFFVAESGTLKEINTELPITKEQIDFQINSIKQIIDEEGA